MWNSLQPWKSHNQAGWISAGSPKLTSNQQFRLIVKSVPSHLSIYLFDPIVDTFDFTK